MTEKLYYVNSHMKNFTAQVTSCEHDGKRWCITLDRTAFFPEVETTKSISLSVMQYRSKIASAIPDIFSILLLFAAPL